MRAVRPAGPLRLASRRRRGRRQHRRRPARPPRRHPHRHRADAAWMARKIRDVRILRDEQSVGDVGAPVLLVSQFTLYGDARKGRRPTWSAAAPGPVSEPRLRRRVRASWSGSARTSSAGRLRRRHAGRVGQRRAGHVGPSHRTRRHRLAARGDRHAPTSDAASASSRSSAEHPHPRMPLPRRGDGAGHTGAPAVVALRSMRHRDAGEPVRGHACGQRRGPHGRELCCAPKVSGGTEVSAGRGSR